MMGKAMASYSAQKISVLSICMSVLRHWIHFRLLQYVMEKILDYRVT